MELIFPLTDEPQTLALAKCFAEQRPPRPLANEPVIIYLQGDLGAGKTTFSRGFIQAMGYTGKVKSPTYTIIEPYELAEVTVIHMDLYRLSDPEELDYLGIDELAGPGTICLIEWPERGQNLLPAANLSLLLEHRSSGRDAQAQAHCPTTESWLQRVASHFFI